MLELDSTDRAIVDLLLEDGRMPCAEIARRIGNISERTARYRLERMRAAGVFQVSAVVNPKAFGMMVVADVLMEVEPAYILEVAEKAAQYDNVSYVACSIGNTDVSVQVVGADTSDIYAFVTGTLGKLPGIRKTTTSIVPKVVKDVYQWRVPRPK